MGLNITEGPSFILYNSFRGEKKMKKLLLILLSMFCLLSLTACGGSDDAVTSDDGSIVIKLGCSGPLTGDAKAYGEAVKNAAQLAVDEINASDSKIKFDFNMQDDAHKVEQAATAYSTLYDWGMQVSLFTVTSAPGAAVASNYDEDKIFALTPSGSATDLIYVGDKNFKGNFQMCFTDPNQGVASADYIAENFKDAKVAIIYKSDDVYSSGIYEKFLEEAKVKNINVVGDEKQRSFTDDSDTEFTVQLGAARDAGADLVFMPIYYQPSSLILDQANKMNYSPVFFGVDGMDGILELDKFDKSLAEGVYLLTPFSATSTDETTAHFVNAYKAAYGEIPNQFAADGYDSVYAIHQALENIGVTADYDFGNLYDDMIKQFTTMTFNGLTGTSMTWAENGEVKKAPEAFIIKDGVYVK